MARRLGTLGVLSICAGLTLAALSIGAASSASSTSGSGPYYLALGDSVPMWNGSNSYPYQIGS